MAKIWVDCFRGGMKDQAPPPMLCLAEFNPDKTFEFADSLHFAGHEDIVTVFKAFIEKFNGRGIIPGL